MSSCRIAALKGKLIVLALVGLTSCTSRPGSSQASSSQASSSASEQPSAVRADKPFVAAGNIDMRLSAGDYTIRAGSDTHVRVSFGGNSGGAVAQVTTTGTHANVSVSDTPHDNFRAVIEIPSAADLIVHLTAGNLEISGIAGNKDIDSTAGNVGISVGDANDYSSVDASVKVGDLSGGPFGKSQSGFASHLNWSGPGKYTLHASLGAGNLTLKR